MDQLCRQLYGSSESTTVSLVLTATHKKRMDFSCLIKKTNNQNILCSIFHTLGRAQAAFKQYISVSVTTKCLLSVTDLSAGAADAGLPLTQGKACDVFTPVCRLWTEKSTATPRAAILFLLQTSECVAKSPSSQSVLYHNSGEDKQREAKSSTPAVRADGCQG